MPVVPPEVPAQRDRPDEQETTVADDVLEVMLVDQRRPEGESAEPPDGDREQVVPAVGDVANGWIPELGPPRRVGS